jgi:hypothetical protein
VSLANLSAGLALAGALAARAALAQDVIDATVYRWDCRGVDDPRARSSASWRAAMDAGLAALRAKNLDRERGMLARAT